MSIAGSNEEVADGRMAVRELQFGLPVPERANEGDGTAALDRAWGIILSMILRRIGGSPLGPHLKATRSFCVS